MIRALLVCGSCMALAGCMAAAVPAADLVVSAVGKAVASRINPTSEAFPARPAEPQPAAAPASAATPAQVTVLDFDVPSDALKAKDGELSLLLRKAGEVALKYDVPVVLVSSSADRDYLMQELNQAGEPAIMYRLGEYPRITISLKQSEPPRQGGRR